ncbi:hypothetical protein GCM10018793_33740 [Streptomyces sulfonofaciens]|uniref:Uncharacterized protein n=1 Tax=Streptomyces sulfonofaciens TaxID=68272 RepID=A0A919L048_9ACTN|nr:hypothetical protein GCM10018793_33740 [Streptomyces sulfonofaciens]
MRTGGVHLPCPHVAGAGRMLRGARAGAGAPRRGPGRPRHPAWPREAVVTRLTCGGPLGAGRWAGCGRAARATSPKWYERVMSAQHPRNTAPADWSPSAGHGTPHQVGGETGAGPAPYGAMDLRSGSRTSLGA